MTTIGIGVTTWFLPVRGASTLKWARSAGFNHLHVDFGDVPTFADRAAFRAISDSLGIRLAGLAVDQLESVGIWESEATACVESAIDAALDLGIDYVYLPSFAAAEMRTPSDITGTASLLRRAVRSAQPHGITIGTENTLAAAELDLLFDLVDEPALDLLFDTQNLCIRGIDSFSVLGEHGARVRRYAHVKDGGAELGDRRLGSGDVRLAEILGALDASGFQGVHVIESDYRTAGPDAPRQDQRWLANALASIRQQRVK